MELLEKVVKINAKTTKQIQDKQTSLKPRDYQIEAIRALENERIDANSAGLLVMATGTGKTVTSAFDTMRSGIEKVLFIAHQKEILNQAKDEYEKAYRKNIDTGLLTGEEKNYSRNFTFATVQTLNQDEHLDRFDPDHFDYIVIDEFHHAQADTYQKILDHFNPKFTLGLTATPFLVGVSKDDLLKLLDLNEVTFRYESDEAIRNNDLAQFEAHIFKDKIDYDDAPEDLNESDLNQKLFLPERNKYIARKWRETTGDRKTIVFCRSIEHANRSAQHFQEVGIEAEAVHNEIPAGMRDSRITRFRKGDLQVLTGVDIFNEGVDFPDVSCLVFMRPTMSKRIFNQQLGRGLRKVKGKNKTVVLDFVNETDWDRLEWYGVDVESNYETGECDECGRRSNKLLDQDGEDICKDCRTENVKIITDSGPIEIDKDAFFSIVEEYQSYRFNRYGASREELIEDLLRVSEEIGSDKVTVDDYRDNGKYSLRPYLNEFENWAEAVEEAGLEYSQRYDIEREKLINDLHRVADKLGNKVLKTSDYEEHGKYGVSTVCQNLADNRWTDALEEAGLEPGRPGMKHKSEKVQRQEVIKSIKKADEMVDGIMSLSDYRDADVHSFGNSEMQRLFGGWNAAKEAAGVETYGHDVSKEEVLDDLKKCSESINGFLSKNKYDQVGEWNSGVVEKRFDTWNKAKEKAGLETMSPGSNSKSHKHVKDGETNEN